MLRTSLAFLTVVCLVLSTPLGTSPLYGQSRVTTIDLSTGDTLSFELLADDLAERDVIFLGEEHDSQPGHQSQARLLTLLHQRRPHMVISMEMFERDVQGTLDDYLRGNISEEMFLKAARPWSNHDEAYKPILEFAKTHRLRVLAANLPRPIASFLAEGSMVPEPLRSFLPRETTAPEDGYWRQFEAIMSYHAGSSENDQMMKQYYESQCAKDDTMAETISDCLNQYPHERPLIVHVCGKFHVDFGLGTAMRFLTRQPLAHIGIVTMESIEDGDDFHWKKHRGKAHYLWKIKRTLEGEEEADPELEPDTENLDPEPEEDSENPPSAHQADPEGEEEDF
ncbi:ABC transporter permease [Planctomycetales bacterium 10988]|nr:ABC transporter permease [Planctomycetales bacterium 10988]